MQVLNSHKAVKLSVERNTIRSAVRERILALKGIEALEYLDQDFRQEIEQRERDAESNGAVGGLMAFVNTGVWDVLTRQEVFVIVARPKVEMLYTQEHLVHIVDQKGQVIGEYLPEGKREEVETRDNAYLLSEDFVLYGDVDIVGEPYFLIPPMPFPPLDDMPEIKRLVSASISTVSDDYIRDRLGYGNTKCWTHLVGYDL
ncbi:MAG TPA: hypothetical protein HA343_07375 [Methanomassiliicoccales archaeon]|nr:hypothetical protein [Methanomassiliicoccales archaeon]